MVKLKSNHFSKKSKFIFISLSVVSLIFFGCSSSEEEITDFPPSVGVLTELTEEPDGRLLIINEQLLMDPNESIAIVHRLDGSVDTCDIVHLRSGKNTESGISGSILRSVMMYSLMSHVLTNRMSGTSPSASVYKSSSVHAKSASHHTNMHSTSAVTARRKRNISKGKSGYGSSKSSRRSYGG